MIIQKSLPFLQRCVLQRSLVSYQHCIKKLSGEVEYATPTTLLITCMDSRIDPTCFIEMKPGSTYIIRNPGNFIPHSDDMSLKHVSTVLAGLELTTNMESVTDVIVCGHCDCKAIQGLQKLKQSSEDQIDGGYLTSWLLSRGERTWHKYMTEQKKHGSVIVYDNLMKKQRTTQLENKLPRDDIISQINVLQQMENVASYDFMKAALARGIKLHGMWLDVKLQITYIFAWTSLKFVELKSDEGAQAYSQT